MTSETMPSSRITARRRIGRVAARVGVVVSAVMLVLSVAAAFDIGRPPVNAQTNAGSAVVVSAQLPTTGSPITTGGSATVFSLQLPDGAACTGDSVSSDYRVQSYMVPASVDPGSLTYAAQGPIPLGTGADYRQPLFTINTQRYVNITTGPADTPGGGGQVPTIAPFDFAAAPFASGASFLPPGPYNVGIACTRAGGSVLDKYWNVVMTFATDANDTPSGFTWSAAEDTTTTTTVAGDTTTTVAGATTTVAGATTTTVAGATTTTVAGATTTAPGTSGGTVSPAAPSPGGSYRVTYPSCQPGETITFSQAQSTPASVTAVCAASSTLGSGSVAGFARPQQLATGTATGSFTAAPTASGTYTVTMKGSISAERTTTFVITATSGSGSGSGSSAGGGSSTGSSTGTIPATGSSTTSIIVWGILLLVFGRVAILLGRKPKVLTGVG